MCCYYGNISSFGISLYIPYKTVLLCISNNDTQVQDWQVLYRNSDNTACRHHLFDELRSVVRKYLYTFTLFQDFQVNGGRRQQTLREFQNTGTRRFDHSIIECIFSIFTSIESKASLTKLTFYSFIHSFFQSFNWRYLLMSRYFLATNHTINFQALKMYILLKIK